MISIPLFLFLFASIEFGRGMMCVQTMEEAARAGCRISVIKSATTSDVEAEVAQVMQLAGIVTYDVAIEPANFTTIDRWEPITVTVSANFDDMSWLPMPGFLGGLSFTGSCVMPKESSPDA